MQPFDITAFLRAALAEDIGSGDITSLATIPAGKQARLALNARAEMVVCGLKFLPELFTLIDPAVKLEATATDGQALAKGATIGFISGSARSVLAVERTALNLLQHLSGVATLTAQYVAAVRGTNAKIYDTRKTIPGLRHVQKYAVRCGGGHNHRMGLYDAVLIKDNHIAVVGGVKEAVAAARNYIPPPAGGRLGGGPNLLCKTTSRTASDAPHLTSPLRGEELTIEVECDTLAQVEEAIAASPDIILLDNMDHATLKQAVARIAPHGILTEASGNVSLETVRGIAETGVDRISVGKLTHSAVAVDIGLDEV